MQTGIDRLGEYRENPRIGKLYVVVTKQVWDAGSVRGFSWNMALRFKILWWSYSFS